MPGLVSVVCVAVSSVRSVPLLVCAASYLVRGLPLALPLCTTPSTSPCIWVLISLSYDPCIPLFFLPLFPFEISGLILRACTGGVGKNRPCKMSALNLGCL